MKKRILIASVLLCVLLSSNLYAATYSTSRSGSSQGYTVTARANWSRNTGEYVSKGPHTIVDKPSHLFTIYEIDYLNTQIDNDRFEVRQYFRPAYYNVIGGMYTFGNSFNIRLTTNGPY